MSPRGSQELDDDVKLPLPIAVSAPAVPSLWGIPLKYLSLVTLAVQNSSLTIIMHYSRVSTPPERTYSAATAVLMNEILKAIISLVIAFYGVDTSGMSSEVGQAPHTSPSRLALRMFGYRLTKLRKDVLSRDCWKLSIPAILYVIQNNLQYVAASNLEVATFQVSYQMKILTTAAFSVLLLRKKLSSTQWLSLVCLAVGVGIVQIQGSTGSSHSVVESAHAMNSLTGFSAVTAACFTSGLAGVYFEMVLKNSQSDLWVRSLQLSLFSLLPALAPVIFNQRAQMADNGGNLFSGLFYNFGAWAWATVLTQVLGGLITALVIKYADNIMKGFATSLSIVISFLASVALFDFRLSVTFLLGSTVVLIATWLYNHQPARATSARSIGAMVSDVWISLKSEEGWKDRNPGSQRSGTPNKAFVAHTASSSSSLSIPLLPPSSSSSTPSLESEKTIFR
ncbi:nucleotide-sugar transporter-domain-containing protein [Crepidotus variabilis]|uniref:Nucleotide-sugar transporter-domain-containing protein n=1 Tax=Crepidotus variabilis TaxID=179855 RepID=A0A9P6ESF4_9AGAR|nr:nucleotide-sugar transporter-domain-containing protein [Crepidotus variabilis]